MSNLMEMYQKHHPLGGNLSYQNWKLEIKFKKHFGEDNTIIPQLSNGKSNIVMNSLVNYVGRCSQSSITFSNHIDVESIRILFET